MRKRRKFGQHFLNDESIAEKIVSFSSIKQNDTVIEVGPGKGILTSPLIEQASEVIAVEIDGRLIRYLEKRFSNAPGLTLIHKDFLKYDLPDFSEKVTIIGNLPYSVGTRIIKHLIEYRERFSTMIFMMQKEVADRLAATAGEKDYGSLSIFIQLHFDVEILMNIPPGAFSPPPKVHSSVIRMEPKQNVLRDIVNPQLFYKVVKMAFSHRRKKLRNNLKILSISDYNLKKISEKTGIDLDLRGEMLSIEEYMELTRHIAEHVGENNVTN